MSGDKFTIKAPPNEVAPLVVRDKQGRDLVRVDANLVDVHYTSESDLVEAIKAIARHHGPILTPRRFRFRRCEIR